MGALNNLLSCFVIAFFTEMTEKALEDNSPRPCDVRAAVAAMAHSSPNWSVSFSPSTPLRDGKPPLSSQGNNFHTAAVFSYSSFQRSICGLSHSQHCVLVSDSSFSVIHLVSTELNALRLHENHHRHLPVLAKDHISCRSIS